MVRVRRGAAESARGDRALRPCPWLAYSFDTLMRLSCHGTRCTWGAQGRSKAILALRIGGLGRLVRTTRGGGVFYAGRVGLCYTVGVKSFELQEWSAHGT